MLRSYRGSSRGDSSFESIESKPVSNRLFGGPRNIVMGPPGELRPSRGKESPSASWWHSFTTPSRNGDLFIPDSTNSDLNPEREPTRTGDHTAEQKGTWQSNKRIEISCNAGPTRRSSQRKDIRRRHTLGIHPFQKSGSHIRGGEERPTSLRDFDPPARDMFLDFYERNLREQKRYGIQVHILNFTRLDGNGAAIFPKSRSLRW